MTAAYEFVLGTGERGDVSMHIRDLLESRMLVQGMSGSGKSGAIRRILEQTHGRVQQIIIDPEGEFATLREAFDDYVIAGTGGDGVPAEPKSAALLARRVLDLGVSIIIDISELHAAGSRASSREQQQDFVGKFVQALVDYRKPHPEALVVIDEAHLFCPEGGSAVSSIAVKDLCSLGRKRGLCAVLATQRISKLNKDAAAELANKLIGRTGVDIDKRRAGDDLGFDRLARDSLQELAPREFYAHGPGFLGPAGVQKVRIGDLQTSIPRGSQRSLTPPMPADGVRDVLAQLADIPAEAAREARSLEELQTENARLKRELSSKRAAAQAVACDHEAELEQLRTERGQFQDAAANYQVRLSWVENRLPWLAFEVKKLTEAIITDADNLAPLERSGNAEETPGANRPEPVRPRVEPAIQKRVRAPGAGMPAVRDAAPRREQQGRDTEDMKDEEVVALIRREVADAIAQAQGVVRVEVPPAEIIRHEYQRKVVARLLDMAMQMETQPLQAVHFMLGQGDRFVSVGQLTGALGGSNVQWGRIVSDLKRKGLIQQGGISGGGAGYKPRLREFVKAELKDHSPTDEEVEETYQALLGRIATQL